MVEARGLKRRDEFQVFDFTNNLLCPDGWLGAINPQGVNHTAKRRPFHSPKRQFERFQRTLSSRLPNYSNPPTHGGALVAGVLASAELRQIWEAELAVMRDRIRAMRIGLVDALKAQVEAK